MKEEPKRMTTDAARCQLDEQGYVLLEGFMLSTGERLLGEVRRRILDILEEEGDRAGHEFKTEATARRLANDPPVSISSIQAACQPS